MSGLGKASLWASSGIDSEFSKNPRFRLDADSTVVSPVLFIDDMLVACLEVLGPKSAAGGAGLGSQIFSTDRCSMG